MAAREAEEATRIKASQVVESAVNILADEAKDILNVVGLGRAGDALGSSINLFGRGLARAGSVISDIIDDDDEEAPKGETPKKRGAPRACPRARPASSPAPPSHTPHPRPPAEGHLSLQWVAKPQPKGLRIK